jgi:valyl-tRNA synthetase
VLAALAKAGIRPDPAAAAGIARLRALVAGVRALKATAGLASRKDITVTLIPRDAAARDLALTSREKILRLAGLADLRLAEDTQGRPGEITDAGTLLLEQSGVVDVAAERTRLSRELERHEKAVAAGEAKLSSEAFVSKAPPAILEGAKRQLEEARSRRDEAARMLAALS